MDKKQNRSGQGPAKGPGTDSKKTQDVVNGKYWPRGGRKREPTGGSFPIKNEPSRKPVPQRNKFLDKRPKPRGYYNTGPNSGKPCTELENHEFELGSVFVQGSKKQSLNHLLNFHYASRGDHFPTSRGNCPSGHHRWLSTQKHKYNKEQFLQANCQFVVNAEGDYKLYLNNPDALVDWNLVEQIHVQVTEFPSCPICLYPPVAAKMTRCGHIYCWSCILHYLGLSETLWRKCPICYEAIYKDDLKSVIAIPHSAFNVGEYLTLRLMKRAQGSLTAFPVDESNLNRNEMLNLSEDKVNTIYSKLLLANSSEVLSIINRERSELTYKLNTEEKCYVDEALYLLNERENSVLNKCSSKTEEATKDNGNRTNSHSLSSSEGLENADFLPSSFGDEASNTTVDNNCDNNIKYYYFYQASDGQCIYLHAINIRMLEHTYGALEYCPPTIKGRIIEKEGGSMTEELRRRLRCLQHLPLTCQFEIVEIDLKPPIIHKETLMHFSDQLETRRRRRQKQARDEKRREKHIQEEENRRLGKLPEVNMHIESLQQFPEFFGGEDPPLSTNSEIVNKRSSSPSLVGSVSKEEQFAGPSFAKMLASGKPKFSGWCKWSELQPKPHLINVTHRQTSAIRTRTRYSESDPECEDDNFPIPTFNQSFSTALETAFEQATISDRNDLGQNSGESKKKKKNKQKLLFATSMVYSGK